MTDDELDRALIVADPLEGIREGDFDFAPAEEELLAEILATPYARITRPRPRPSRWRAVRLVVAFGCIVAVALVALALLDGSDGGSGKSSAFAAEAVKVAEANRRLLVTEPGWDIYYAQFDSPESGEVGFDDEKGTHSRPAPCAGCPHGGDILDMHWYPADEYRMRTREQGNPVDIAGEQGLEYALAGPSKEFQVELPVRDGSFMIIRGSAANAEDFYSRLDSIVATDVETWLEAMPDSVVKPADQSSGFDRVLEGVPLPDGFDRSAIEPESMPQDSYQFTAYVLYGAYCGWLDEWWRADKAGDKAAAQAAIDQLLNAENWPAVKAQAKTGALDQDFRMYANTVAKGDGDKQVYDQMMNCIEYP